MLNKIIMLVSGILLLPILSCREGQVHDEIVADPPNSNCVEVQLVDSLGTLVLSVPDQYDTSFSWIHFSDCKSCHEQKYRFQPKALSVTKESGWIWLGEPKDSVDRLTISHSSFIYFHEGDSNRISRLRGIYRKRAFEDYKRPALVFDSIQIINGRYFAVFAAENFDTTQSKRVMAVTTIKSNEIVIKYELITTKSDSVAANFIKNSLALLKTIRFSKGM